MAYIDPNPEKVADGYTGPFRVRWRFGRTRNGKFMHAQLDTLDDARKYLEIIVNSGQRDKPSREVLISHGLRKYADADPDLGPSMAFPSKLETLADIHAAARSLLTSVGRANLTVEQVVICYLSQLANQEGAPKESTLTDYIGYLRNHIMGTDFGRMLLSAATGEDAQAWQKGLRGNVKRSRGEGTIGANTIIKIRQSTMGPAMIWASAPDLGGRPAVRPDNVFARVKYPEPDDVEMDVITTPELAEEILGLARKVCPAFAELVMFELYTGVRFSEAARLQCRDLTTEKGYPAVRIRISKTKSGKRYIPLHPDYFDHLVMLIGTRPSDAPLLGNRQGREWRDSTARVRWIEVTDLYNAAHPFEPKRWRGHSLRHTFASVLTNDGAVNDKVIDMSMGHRVGGRSRKNYADITPSGAATVANVMHGFVKRLGS